MSLMQLINFKRAAQQCRFAGRTDVRQEQERWNNDQEGV